MNRSLENCQLLVDRNSGLAETFAATWLSARVGLLYPDDKAPVLTELPAAEKPDQLVILDGTWHQAKTLTRDIPRLGELKRYRLAPTTPGQYRIRREPNMHALSTIEATVAALQSLEPETKDLDKLLAVFDRMISKQLSHPKSGWRQNNRRRRGLPNVPRALTGDLSNIVVAYGDQERIERTSSGAAINARPRPIYWTAKRLVTGETFRCTIDCPSLRDANFLNQLRLDEDDLTAPVNAEDFRSAWAEYLRPQDQLAVYQSGTAKLLANIAADFCPVILLKSISLDTDLQRGTLADFLTTQGITSQSDGSSRASRRLADSVAFIEFLNRKFKSQID